MQKPTLPKGTRDFGPVQMARRNFIFDTIKKTFQQFGFLPLETPAMENLSVLMGKYGEEGDQLLFKILDSGDFYEKMIGNVFANEVRDRINNSLGDFFSGVFRMAFTQLSNDETRTPDKIKAVIEILLNNFSNAYLTREAEETLKRFLIERIDQVSNKLINFFIKSGLYRETFDEKFEFAFNQFRNTTLFEIQSQVNSLASVNVTKYKESPPDVLHQLSSKEVTREISEKGLRYDLTVPFARYVVMNRNDITFPFKRYQIQPVWRGDRPQKGRYREFYQCDADVVGTNSLLCEAEIICMINQVLDRLDITDFTIKVNNRKILTGIIEAIQAQDKEQKILTVIDKLDKIGKEAVMNELSVLGLSPNQLEVLDMIFSVHGNSQEKLEQLRTTRFTYTPIGQQGIKELQEIISLVHGFGLQNPHLEFDVTLARGLSYYTGAIFEVKVNNVSIGSISGGGRYDNLTGAFGLPGVSGVGFSFGVDRIYDVMEELGLFPAQSATSTRVLLVAFDAEAQRYALPVLRQLREAGINSELYPDPAKLKKQLDYANAKGIPYVVLIGSNEMATGQLALKNMTAGTQQSLGLADLIKAVRT